MINKNIKPLQLPKPYGILQTSIGAMRLLGPQPKVKKS